MSELSSVQKDKLMSDVRTFISDAKEVMRSTVDETGQSNEVRDRVLNLLQEARVELASLQKMAATKAKEASQATDEYVHENPWQSVGIAAGIGLIVGLLLARR
jgi:ElaB/YqjD/DUF883 family membrane-anchored ribosome-binding protein